LRGEIQSLAASLDLQEKVRITGFVRPADVAAFLNSSDLYVTGSHKEGWSLAMLEALACGKAIVTTKVSGSDDLIVEGVNGFVINERDPRLYASKMLAAMDLPHARSVSVSIARRYALNTLAEDLGKLWAPLRRSEHSGLP
jgi:glycosyltransferase involved in cell wall biosynthesis